MRRKDIKRGTQIIIISVFLLFIIIILIATIRNSGGKSATDESEMVMKGEQWGDTLRNASSDVASLHRMDEELKAFLRKYELKGMSVAVMRHDSLLYAKGIGMADDEKNIQMEANTISRIASVSKLITATAVMRLVEQGKLTLDDHVFGAGGILGDEKYASVISDDRMYDITVRRLLMHEAGFTNRRGDPMFNMKELMEAAHLRRAPGTHELVEIVLSRRLGYAPGAGHKYSNFGYLLLSLIIEKKTGKSYWEAVEDEVLHPAGCYQFRPATNYYADRHARETRYYPPEDSLVEEYTGSGKMVSRVYGGSNVNGLMGAGGWVTSAADLARFVAAIDGDDRVPDIISRKSFEEMTKFDPDKKVAFGWSSVDESGKLERTGTLSSTNSIIKRFPDGECWIIITNTGYWTGFKFSKVISGKIDQLRERYSAKMPSRDLFPK